MTPDLNPFDAVNSELRMRKIQKRVKRGYAPGRISWQSHKRQKFHCKTCKRSFPRMEVLLQHFRDSDRHRDDAEYFEASVQMSDWLTAKDEGQHCCPTCCLGFKTEPELLIHLKHAKVHQDSSEAQQASLLLLPKDEARLLRRNLPGSATDSASLATSSPAACNVLTAVKPVHNDAQQPLQQAPMAAGYGVNQTESSEAAGRAQDTAACRQPEAKSQSHGDNSLCQSLTEQVRQAGSLTQTHEDQAQDGVKEMQERCGTTQDGSSLNHNGVTSTRCGNSLTQNQPAQAQAGPASLHKACSFTHIGTTQTQSGGNLTQNGAAQSPGGDNLQTPGDYIAMVRHKIYGSSCLGMGSLEKGFLPPLNRRVVSQKRKRKSATSDDDAGGGSSCLDYGESKLVSEDYHNAAMVMVEPQI